MHTLGNVCMRRQNRKCSPNLSGNPLKSYIERRAYVAAPAYMRCSVGATYAWGRMHTLLKGSNLCMGPHAYVAPREQPMHGAACIRCSVGATYAWGHAYVAPHWYRVKNKLKFCSTGQVHTGQVLAFRKEAGFPPADRCYAWCNPPQPHRVHPTKTLLVRSGGAATASTTTWRWCQMTQCPLRAT